jgi:hypothetical protein
MKTRCKFKCQSITHRIYKGEISGVEVGLYPQYSNDPNSENKAFWDATPAGKLELSLKPSLAGLFESDKEYYIDISSVEV